MKTLVVIGNTRWSGIFGRTQQIISRLTDDYKIIYINPPNRTTSTYLTKMIIGGITVLEPNTQETVNGWNANQIKVILPMIKPYIDEPVDIWFADPSAVNLIDKIVVDKIFYDIASICQCDKSDETILLNQADLIICQTEQLRDIYLPTLNIHVIPNGVDGNYFDKLLNELKLDLICPNEQLTFSIPQIRIGYFGNLDNNVDFELINNIAHKNPHWHILLIGPIVNLDPASLPTRRNIHYLGEVPYNVLPQVLNTCQIGILPLLVNRETKLTQPISVLECLAGGLPVVSTNLPAVETLSPLINIAHTEEEFINAITLNIGEILPPDELAELLTDYDWNKIVNDVNLLIQ